MASHGQPKNYQYSTTNWTTSLTSQARGLPRRKLGLVETLSAVLSGILLIAALHFLSGIDWLKPSTQVTTALATSDTGATAPRTTTNPPLSILQQADAATPTNTSEQRLDPLGNYFTIPQSLTALWSLEELRPEQIDSITDQLMQLAALAAAEQDEQRLGESLALLGMHSLRQDDADSASVYLGEALDAFEQLEDQHGIAGVELLRGKMHVQSRERARSAALAYDDLQIAGWTIANGRFDESINRLRNIIDTNLAMDRFGAASAAYDYLYRGFSEQGQLDEAQQAGIEIVRLQASSGRPLKATAMLNKLRAAGLDQDSLQSLQSEIITLQGDYAASVQQIGESRDYQQLYHHFINAGDPVRAWQFRIKATNSLRNVSKRAMHRRQAGVMALLFNSNQQMRQAHRSLQRASGVFEAQQQTDYLEAAEELRNRIY